MIICFAAVALAILTRNTNTEVFTEEDPFEVITNYDFDVKYPNGPYEVINAYNYTVQYLYGGEVAIDEIPHIVEQQRHLFSTELLNVNPYTDQVENLTAEILTKQETEDFVLAIEQKIPQNDGENPLYSYCDVTQYMKNGNNGYVRYTLVNEKNKWKIATWDPITKEEVKNEGL